MQASDLAELAAVVAVHFPSFLVRGGRVPSKRLAEYWTAARCRQERWTRVLRETRGLPPNGSGPDGDGIRKPLAEEVLAGEVLTRIWAAAITAHDKQHDAGDCEPLARSVYQGHLETRNRVLHDLVRGDYFTGRQLDALNLLRRRMERWTDALLAHLAPAIDVTPWCFDEQRTADFIQDLEDNPSPPNITLPYVTASIRAAVRATVRSPAPNPTLNQRLAAAVVAGMPCDAIDATHLPLALWLERMSCSAEDAQGLLDELYVMEGLGAGG